MKSTFAIISLVVLLVVGVQGCKESKSPSPNSGTTSAVMPAPATGAKIVTNNFSDDDYKAGVRTKNGHKNEFYFLYEPAAAANPVTVGTKLVFAKSGEATVTKVEMLDETKIKTAKKGEMFPVFVTVDHELDPAGDGSPNTILVQ